MLFAYYSILPGTIADMEIKVRVDSCECLYAYVVQLTGLPTSPRDWKPFFICLPVIATTGARFEPETSNPEIRYVRGWSTVKC
ncbi:hypothetical protein DPMN_110834 [Dreissena polymorpha]|uniref:Uncharacterized protein n=1 Tax=Dreissena polymorpha TaxID=45954 RepID=A0A9D4KD72_DREPO|nr:hypothetical protein DPMN_110765 [Dreissena polymorpha]KAH3837444.1 hypothetical protein DPMN_110834 [Dreissena polymorpha]